MDNKDKVTIKKMLLSLEDDPAQVDMYLNTLQGRADADEALAYAWQIITTKFDDENADALKELRSATPAPDYGEGDPSDFDSDDGDDEDEEDDVDGDEDDEDDAGDDDEDEDENEDEDEDEDDEDSSDGTDTNRPDESVKTPAEVPPKVKIPVTSKTGDGEDETSVKTERIAGVDVPIAEKHTTPVIGERPPVVMPETSLYGMRETVARVADDGTVLTIPINQGLKAGPVYVLPADTGKEAEIRVLELRAATNENLELARKIHAEIMQSVAEERKIRDDMVLVVGAYDELAKRLVDNAQTAAEIRQKLVEGTVRAERFMNDEMSRMLQQKAMEATNDFYQESKDHYNDLFKHAVRKYKQFTEAAMAFQDKMSDENARQVRSIVAKLNMLQKVVYAMVFLMIVVIVMLVIFKFLIK